MYVFYFILFKIIGFSLSFYPLNFWRVIFFCIFVRPYN